MIKIETQIYQIIIIGFTLLFSISISLVTYFILSKINLLPNKSMDVFFQKTIEETQRSINGAENKTIIDQTIDKIIDAISDYFDIKKIEKNIQRSGIKEYKSLSDMILNGILYSAILFITLFISTSVLIKILGQNIGIMKILSIVSMPLGFYIPFAQVNSELEKRDKEVKFEMPQVLDLIRQGVGAGLLFSEALKEARPQNGGAVDFLLKDVIAEIETSGDHVKAMSKMADKISDEKIREFLQQLVIAVDADKERQIDICSSLANNVRELEDISKNMQIDSVDSFLNGWQWTCQGVVAAVFIIFVAYDTLMQFQ